MTRIRGGTSHYLRFTAISFLVIAVAALLLACGDDNGEADDNGTVSTLSEVRSQVSRAGADVEAGRQTAAAAQAFALDMYQLLAREDGNLVFSPHSIAIALAMTRAGANGQTAAEMDAVLYADIAGDLHAGFNAIDQALARRSGEYPIGGGDETAELVLSMANQLFGQQGFEFGEPFLERLAADYGAGMKLVDYAGAYEEARVLINEWVAQQTRDRIPDLIPDGVLDDMTRLVLTNAIYLNAPWAHRFNDEATARGPFTRLDGSEVTADMMRLDARIRYGEGADYQAVELPYVDGSLAMVVVLPRAGQFEAFQQGLDSAKLNEVLASLGDAQVNLTFPRFEFRTRALLKGVLSELGMPVAFDSDHADFSGIAPTRDDGYLQDVVHEAFISVDEHGTEAAAASAVVFGITSAPPVNVDMDVDRPFLFFIRDGETGAILFMGRVLDPTE